MSSFLSTHYPMRGKGTPCISSHGFHISVKDTNPYIRLHPWPMRGPPKFCIIPEIVYLLIMVLGKAHPSFASITPIFSCLPISLMAILTGAFESWSSSNATFVHCLILIIPSLTASEGHYPSTCSSLVYIPERRYGVRDVFLDAIISRFHCDQLP